jgi:hypothetical protein
MNKIMFMKSFLEIYIGKKIHQPDDFFDSNFNVTITPKQNGENQIAVFSGDHGIFPIILEITDNPHYIELGYIDVFLITNKPVRKGKKKRDLLKLIMKYLQTNNLVKISHD